MEKYRCMAFKNPNQPNEPLPDPICNQCNEKIYENANHYILQCKKYKQIRIELLNNIKNNVKAYNNYKLHEFDINDLLYPYYNNIKLKFLNKKTINYQSLIKTNRSVLGSTDL